METPKLATKSGVRKCKSVVECRIREAISCALFVQCMCMVDRALRSIIHHSPWSASSLRLTSLDRATKVHSH